MIVFNKRSALQSQQQPRWGPREDVVDGNFKPSPPRAGLSISSNFLTCLTMSDLNEIRKPILTWDCRLWLVFLPHYFLLHVVHKKLSECPGFAELCHKPLWAPGVNWQNTGAVIGPGSASKPSFLNFLCASLRIQFQNSPNLWPSTGHKFFSNTERYEHVPKQSPKGPKVLKIPNFSPSQVEEVPPSAGGRCCAVNVTHMEF